MVPGLGPIEAPKAVLLLVVLSIGLMATIFPRIGWWPVAYVCLVPWLLAVCRSAGSMLVYFSSYLFGIAYFAINAHWIYIVTAPGFVAFALFYGLFPALASWPLRHLVNRRGVPVAIAAPVAWTAMEYLRSLGPLGFPMVLVGHSQYRIESIIQIADIIGAYGVTFVVVAVNGFIVDLMIQPIVRTTDAPAAPRPRGAGRTVRWPVGTLFTVMLVLLTLIYGSAQKSERRLTDGPRIAVVQHDLVQYVEPRHARRLTHTEIFEAHLELARQAAAAPDAPDLIVMPESIIPGCYVNEEFLGYDRDELDFMHSRRYGRVMDRSFLVWCQDFSRHVRGAFQAVCDEFGVSIVFGSSALVSHRSAIPPHVDAMNSAYLFTPHAPKPVARYDKRHLVLLGEYVPFRKAWPAAYQWINSLSPYGGENNHYSLTPGEAFNPLTFTGGPSNTRYRAGTPICYEEIMPYVPREFARGDGGDGKAIDALFCMSNDGWFFHSSELEQHLAAGVFRAVENRVAVARSVNTGASCLIAPNGHIHARVRMDEKKFDELADVEAALEAMIARATEMRDAAPKGAQIIADREALRQIIDGQLRPSYLALGAAFRIYVDRIDRMTGGISPLNAAAIPEVMDEYVAQLNEDLEMVRRWGERPGTAPGVVAAAIRLDPRLTLYTRFGDWFATLLLVVTGIAVLDWLNHRMRRRRRIAAAMEGAIR